MLITKESTALNPEERFFQECLEHAEGRYESSYLIIEAFRSFCIANKIEGNFNIARFLEKGDIQKKRLRIDDLGYKSNKGHPLLVFEGVRLLDNYRAT